MKTPAEIISEALAFKPVAIYVGFSGGNAGGRSIRLSVRAQRPLFHPLCVGCEKSAIVQEEMHGTDAGS